jgi:biopolymer transport protein TolQ
VTFSIGTLFSEADLVVKSVLLVLLWASVWSWYVFFKKFFQIQRVRRLSRLFARQFSNESLSFEQLYSKFGQYPKEPFALAFKAAIKEMPSALSGGSGQTVASLHNQLDSAIETVEMREISSLSHGVNFLASMASTAPFIGLFGTVWGIMRSFSAIASAGDTNLAVVAPAISEALFATALGLFVAIPATLAYNKLSALLNTYETEMTLFSREMRLLLMRNVNNSRRR